MTRMSIHTTNSKKERNTWMNSKKLMIVSACAAIFASAPAYAEEDDFGIESASPIAIADPVNPVPGMVFYAYNHDGYFGKEEMKKCNVALPSMPALVTVADTGKSEDFTLALTKGLKAKTGRWEGFIKCKKSGAYTFTLSKDNVNGNYYVLYVNGKMIVCANGDAAGDVQLKAGWNKVELACQFCSSNPLHISFKPKNNPCAPRPLTPATFFYDKREEEW